MSEHSVLVECGLCPVVKVSPNDQSPSTTDTSDIVDNNANLTIIHCRWLIPVDTDGTRESAQVIPHGGVAILGHHIVDVGSIDKVRSKHPNCMNIVDLSARHILIPG